MDCLHLLIIKKYGKKMKQIKKIKAPRFKLKSTNDEIVELKSIKSSYIVLYF